MNSNADEKNCFQREINEQTNKRKAETSARVLTNFFISARLIEKNIVCFQCAAVLDFTHPYTKISRDTRSTFLSGKFNCDSSR